MVRPSKEFAPRSPSDNAVHRQAMLGLVKPHDFLRLRPVKQIDRYRVAIGSLGPKPLIELQPSVADQRAVGAGIDGGLYGAAAGDERSDPHASISGLDPPVWRQVRGSLEPPSGCSRHRAEEAILDQVGLMLACAPPELQVQHPLPQSHVGPGITAPDLDDVRGRGRLEGGGRHESRCCKGNESEHVHNSRTVSSTGRFRVFSLSSVCEPAGVGRDARRRLTAHLLIVRYKL